MRRFASFLTLLMASSACSAQPQTHKESATRGLAAVTSATITVPRNAPVSTIKNVPATTGKANLAQTPPPFTVTKIGQFKDPFAMAFLSDGWLLVTAKGGHLKLRFPNGVVKNVTDVPPVTTGGQGGLLDVAAAPDHARSNRIYFTFSEPGPDGGSSLALARATLGAHGAACFPPRCPPPEELEYQLPDVQVIWRSGMSGPGGQFGANIVFAPDGKSLFLSSGERQRFIPAQDPEQRLGKVLHLTLDGKAWPGNPQYKAGGARAETWSTGHRNPYGLVFTPDGRLWEEEMGPMGGDELNLVLPGKNYGWPIVSNGDNYSGQPIPDHPSRPDLEAPKLWWNPSISPGGMIYYSGAMFPQYKGSLFIAALSDESLIRVTLSGASAKPAAQWKMGARIRDVAQAPDGSIWLLEDDGVLVRLSGKR